MRIDFFKFLENFKVNTIPTDAQTIAAILYGIPSRFTECSYLLLINISPIAATLAAKEIFWLVRAFAR